MLGRKVIYYGFFFLNIFPIAQTVKNLPAMQETRVQSLSQEDPLEKGMAIHSSILPGKSHGQKSLAGYSLWVCKESDTIEQLVHTTRLLIYLLAALGIHCFCLGFL